MFIFAWVAIHVNPSASVDAGDSGTYMLDQTGEKWDIGQAESLGFKMEGRHAKRHSGWK